MESQKEQVLEELAREQLIQAKYINANCENFGEQECDYIRDGVPEHCLNCKAVKLPSY